MTIETQVYVNTLRHVDSWKEGVTDYVKRQARIFDDILFCELTILKKTYYAKDKEAYIEDVTNALVEDPLRTIIQDTLWKTRAPIEKISLAGVINRTGARFEEIIGAHGEKS